MVLLIGDNDVHIIAGTQAMVRDAEQAICVGRQVYADYIGALIGDYIQKSRILMGKAVVVLPPDQRSNKNIDGRDRSAPIQFLLRFLQPFGVLVEHRIDNVNEGLIS